MSRPRKRSFLYTLMRLVGLLPWVRYKRALRCIANSHVPPADPGRLYRMQDAVYAARTVAREALGMEDS